MAQWEWQHFIFPLQSESMAHSLGFAQAHLMLSGGHVPSFTVTEKCHNMNNLILHEGISDWNPPSGVSWQASGNVIHCPIRIRIQDLNNSYWSAYRAMLPSSGCCCFQSAGVTGRAIVSQVLCDGAEQRWEYECSSVHGCNHCTSCPPGTGPSLTSWSWFLKALDGVSSLRYHLSFHGQKLTHKLQSILRDDFHQ